MYNLTTVQWSLTPKPWSACCSLLHLAIEGTAETFAPNNLDHGLTAARQAEVLIRWISYVNVESEHYLLGQKRCPIHQSYGARNNNHRCSLWSTFKTKMYNSEPVTRDAVIQKCSHYNNTLLQCWENSLISQKLPPYNPDLVHSDFVFLHFKKWLGLNSSRTVRSWKQQH